MPPTKQGDAGGSQSGARARRKHTAVSRPAPTMTTRSRAAEQSLSPQRATERSREDEKSAKRRKRTKVGNQEVAAAATAGSDEDAASGSAGIQEVAAAASAGGHEDAVAASEGIQEDAVAASVPAAAGHVSNTASQSQEDAAASTSAAVLSSTLSSPLRCPFIPEVIKSQDSKRVVYEPFDQAAVKAYLKENKKYTAKLGRHNELLTLNDTCPKTCLDVQKMLPVRESATDTVFQAADSVLGLSSYIDGNLLAQCSGFLINWDKDTKHGTVLTSASLICTKSPRVDLWSCAREYAPEAQVLVHLLDETVVKGNLLHYHRHYNIALFEVVVNMPTKLPLCTKLDYGQEVYLVGRDENMNLNTSHGRVACEDPGLYDHHHFMYVNCGISKFSAGGPAINTDGGVVGMVDPTPRTAFVPTSVILKCVRLWKDFKCVPRLHLGLKLSSIMCLRSSHREKIRRMLKFDAGLIVQEVSEGSAAEKVGIRIGDVIKSLNEECLSTTIELEAMLLRICEDHLDKGSGIGSNVDFTVELLVGIVVGGIVGSVLKKISNSNAKDTQTAGSSVPDTPKTLLH